LDGRRVGERIDRKVEDRVQADRHQYGGESQNKEAMPERPGNDRV
jgi:hypothetical protein